MIQHVTLEVARERAERTASFYELLGFRPAEPPPTLADRALWLQSGDTQVHLLYVDEPSALPHGHLAVVVEDYEQTIGALRGAGHEPEDRPQHWGSPRSYVRDPSGNLVEVMAFPPGTS